MSANGANGEQRKIDSGPANPTTARFPTDPISPTSERPRSFFARNSASNMSNGNEDLVDNFEEEKGKPTRWSMGVLNDPNTHEVPGTNNFKHWQFVTANSFHRLRPSPYWRAKRTPRSSECSSTNICVLYSYATIAITKSPAVRSAESDRREEVDKGWSYCPRTTTRRLT
jgi:hypothetical protein